MFVVSSLIVVAGIPASALSCGSAKEPGGEPGDAIGLPDRREPDDGGDDLASDSSTGKEDGSDATSDKRDATKEADGPRTLRVFVSSMTTTGNIGGLAAADTLCTTLARDAGLGGAWVAWLSIEDGPHAIERVTSSGPWHLRNGDMVVASKAALTTGTLAHAIDRDQNAVAVPAARVWTGSGINGRYDSRDCDKWKTGNEGRVGNSGAVNAAWTNQGVDGCGNVGRLYCFEL